jgi:formylglycine-generating enzyme required for sulfatase activity
MLFPEAAAIDLNERWARLSASRNEAANHWLAEWNEPHEAFDAAHRCALEKETPEAWRALCSAGRKLREAMRNHRLDPDFYPPFFEKLTEFTDAVETALEAAGHIPANVIPPERDELIERISRLEQQVDEERQTVIEKAIRERLDEVSGDLAQSKRTLIKIDQFNLINVDPASIIALIRDALEALKHGIDLLNDPRFTEPLRKRAKIAWLATKRFMQAAKRRFAAFKFPWAREPVFDDFEGPEPDFNLPDDASTPRGLRILIRDGAADREIWRVPEGGEPFRDRFEQNGKLLQGPEMLVVPAGEFMMGAPPGEEARYHIEGPRHRVTISKPFAIGRYPVTFAEWDAAVAAGGVGHKPGDYGWGRGDWPVIDVSWHDAQAYIAWLRKETGKEYRLPSEAEWEYCCRAGKHTPFWWGASISTRQANYDGTSTYGGGEQGEDRGKTLPVKSFDPNPWGLYQVHGNVWEWCNDGPRAYSASSAADPAGPLESPQRALRGGSWHSNAHYVRAASRYANARSYRYGNIGFRCARVL